MGATLFADVRVIDGTGAKPFAADVLVEGNRIAKVARHKKRLDPRGATVIDGGGRTLMPGLTDAHAHLSFLNAPTLEALTAMTVERQVLETAKNARLLLDHGFTSMFSGASVRPRIDVAIRDAINAGDIPGPRLLACTKQMTVTGGFGDLGQGEREIGEHGYAIVLNGPDEFRLACRKAARDGVDTFKIVPSAFAMGSRALVAEDTVMSDAEVAAVCEVARQRNRHVAAHARSADAVKICVRNGVDVIYHATLADEEAKDLLEAKKDRVFVAPAMGLQYARLHEAEKYGVRFEGIARRRVEAELEIVSAVMRDLHKRGVRVLPGGDYGFQVTPHGRNALDLQFFVELYGFTPLEAIRAATQHGGELMGHAGELGVVREGALADLLLVDGDPSKDIRILQDRNRFDAIMKDGVFHKAPPAASPLRVAAE
ncbi:MAG: amidohydrolase family protein [Alphaproteobacteria bacterium]